MVVNLRLGYNRVITLPNNLSATSNDFIKDVILILKNFLIYASSFDLLVSFSVPIAFAVYIR